mgnify:CR=1 FL=1
MAHASPDMEEAHGRADHVESLLLIVEKSQSHSNIVKALRQPSNDTDAVEALASECV